LTLIFRKRNISVMEMTVQMVAGQSARTDRLVRQAVATGRLTALRNIGRHLLIDDVAATAWIRSSARGRLWAPHVREAAVDLLSTGTTEALHGPELSRLVSRLRSMPVPAIAHAAGGLGAWGRYRGTATGTPVGPSALTAGRLGIVEGSGWMTFVSVPDLDAFESSHDVVLDADGEVGVLQRPYADDRAARLLLDCYLLGDARISAAAANELQERSGAL